MKKKNPLEETDEYFDIEKRVRGGNWFIYLEALSLSFHALEDTWNNESNALGFRICRTIKEKN